MTTVNQFFGHVGGLQPAFLCNPEECGYRQREDGVWLDVRGNTGDMQTRELDPAADLDILVAAYAGDDVVQDWRAFREWAVREIGLSEAEAATVGGV